MATVGTTLHTTGGFVSYGWFDGRKAGRIRESVSLAQNATSGTLQKRWPAGSRLIWAAMKTGTAVNPRLASTAAATNGQAGIALVYTAPTSLTTGSTTSNILLSVAQTAFGAAIPIASATRWFAGSAATAGGIISTTGLINTTTSDITLYIVPYASTTGATDATQRFLVNTTTPTSGYTMGGTATASGGVVIDVDVYFEKFDEIATRS